MYTNAHGSTGAIIYSACPNKIVGGFLAFISHFILDHLGEKGYGSQKLSMIIEGAFLTIFLTVACLSTDFSGFAIGWMLGNLPDIIDKGFFTNMNATQYFSCHGHPGWLIGKIKVGIFSIGNWKLGFPTKVQFTKKQTIVSGIMTSISLVIFAYIKFLGII